MASIQILEIRPLEAQVEELSDNIIGNIWGGDDSATLASPLPCISAFLDLLAEFSTDGFTRGEILGATAAFLECVDKLFINV